MGCAESRACTPYGGMHCGIASRGLPSSKSVRRVDGLIEEFLTSLSDLDPQPTRLDGQRYLRSYGQSVSVATARYRETHAWRKAEKISSLLCMDLTLRNASAEAALVRATGPPGMRILESSDKDARPVVYFDLEFFDVQGLYDAGVTSRDILCRFLRTMEWVDARIRKSLYPMRGYLAIFDAKNASAISLWRGGDFFKELARVSEAHYPEFLGDALVVGVSAALKWALETAMTLWMHPDSRRKYRLFSADAAHVLIETGLMTSEQVVREGLAEELHDAISTGG